MNTVLFFVGLGLLVLGAELLVKGASRLALAFKISPLVVGLTVVAFGTSAPELAVSVKAAYAGQIEMAVGNVIGSNIFNVLLILGLSALITPLVVNSQLVKLDVPLMIGASILLLLFSKNGNISFYEAAGLFTVFVVYTFCLINQGRKDGAKKQDGDVPENTGKLPVNLLFIAIGLCMLVAGSNFLVNSAIVFARQLGVSEAVISLTIIAAGTSLPELVTSIVAAFKPKNLSRETI
jgi:cation:H+ antiporter